MENDKRKPTEEEHWSGPGGERWLRNALGMEDMLRPIGEELLRRAALKPGNDVLEIGCGAGGLTLEMARQILPGGTITGLDIAPGLVMEATRRAGEAGLAENAKFVCGDAAKVELGHKADVLASRFGVMFFSDPFAAFTHFHGMLKPDGRVAMAVWQPVTKNPWMNEMRKIIGAHLEIPAVGARTPGPFALEDPGYVRDILGKAGFGAINIDPWETQMQLGGHDANGERAATLMLQSLGIGQKVLDAPEALRAMITNAMAAKLQEFYVPGEGVKMDGNLWFVTARG